MTYYERNKVRIRAEFKRRYDTEPEFREKQKARSRARYAIPAVRARMIAAAKARSKTHRRLRCGKNVWVPRRDQAAMLVAQDGLCAICQVSFDASTRPVTDHCHATGRVRGMLCGRCNLGLGWFKDNPDTLRRAIDYLQPTKNPA